MPDEDCSPAQAVILAKRPVTQGSWACASCEREVGQIQRGPAEFRPWQRLLQPPSTQKNTAAGIGQGFSRVLEQVRPEMVERARN